MDHGTNSEKIDTLKTSLIVPNQVPYLSPLD